MAGLAIGLLGAISVALISRSTGPRPTRVRGGATPAAAPAPAEMAAGTEAEAPAGAAGRPPAPMAAGMPARPASGSPVPATAAPSSSAPAAVPARAPARPSRAVRRHLRAQRIKEQLAAQPSGADKGAAADEEGR